MEKQTAPKWTVTMNATINGTRQTKDIDVYACDRGEARVTAKEVAENKGWDQIILKHSVQN